MAKQYPDKEHPCENCPQQEHCDPFAARYCHKLRSYLYGIEEDDNKKPRV